MRTTRRSRRSEETKTDSVPGSDVKKVITGVCRSSFMRILSLKPKKQDPEKRLCGSGIIIPKSDKATVKKIRRAITVAAQEKFGSDYDPFKSKKLRNPFKDGDELLDDPEATVGNEVENCYLINAKSYNLPGVVNKYGQEIEDPDEKAKVCVSGYYFRFSLYFTAYEVDLEEGGKARGINCYLNNVMFVKEGEPLGGVATKAKDDFADFAEEYDEEEDDEIDFDD